MWSNVSTVFNLRELHKRRVRRGWWVICKFCIPHFKDHRRGDSRPRDASIVFVNIAGRYLLESFAILVIEFLSWSSFYILPRTNSILLENAIKVWNYRGKISQEMIRMRTGYSIYYIKKKKKKKKPNTKFEIWLKGPDVPSLLWLNG